MFYQKTKMTSVGLVLCTLITITSAAQNLAASPMTIDIGLTKSMQIECSSTRDSSIAVVSSIRILFCKNTVQPVFSQLGLVDSVVGIDNSSGAVDSGEIVGDGTSKLRLTWDYPKQDRAGVYKCEVMGKSINGVPKMKSLMVGVGAVVPDHKTFLDYFEKLTDDFDELKASTADVLRMQSELIARLNRGKSKFYSVSNVFQGRRYYLSAYSNVLVTEDAEAMCEIFGGYLVEVDSAEEYQFIVAFLNKFSKHLFVLTGGSDEVLENNWINAYSQTPVKYINWSSREPSGGRDENCLYFYRDYKWFMADVACYKGYAGVFVGYMCEISE